MEVDPIKKVPMRDREFYDCSKLYLTWGDRYNNLKPDQQNAYWFLKLTAAELAKWTSINVFETGQSALESVVHSINNLRIREDKTITYHTRAFAQKPEIEPTKESIKKTREMEGNSSDGILEVLCFVL